MDAIADPAVETVVIMSAAQVGKTEILLNVLGYYIDYDPAPVLMVLPTLELAEAFSKDRLSPMLRDCPTLRGKTGIAKGRDSKSTILHRVFAGGHITMAGANSPASLASRPIRILLADEVDRFPESAGPEGDPLFLAEKRTTTFWNRKKIFVSTPTIQGVSRIEAAFETSTKERWCVACPACGEYQPLTWGQLHFDDMTHECRSCRHRAGEFVWKGRPGAWVAENPEAASRGFHLNEMVSPWVRWDAMVAAFRKAKALGNEGLKTWINTSLGETWEETGEHLDMSSLEDHRTLYPAGADLPYGVAVLTAGVDVQDDRLEVEIVGWGPGKESWGIEYRAFLGDPDGDDVWERLDAFLQAPRSYEDGVQIGISCVCIDSGGHKTDAVYRFTKPREPRGVFAIKGEGGTGKPLVGRVTRTNRARAALFLLGVDSGKETIFSRMKLPEPGPGYCHWPLNVDRGYDEMYFRGLTSERRVLRVHRGERRYEWVKRAGARNEPLDCRNYAMAALEILNPDLESLAKRRVEMGQRFEALRQGKLVPQKAVRRVISRGIG